MQYPLTGFTNERTDPISACLHPGAGTRTYNPALMRFLQPDTLSPFSRGGLNSYLYCENDPVNHSDPSGHLSWQSWLGIGMGILGIGLAVFSAGTSLAAAGSIAAALESTSAASLTLDIAGVAADSAAIASGATEASHPRASSTLGWISLSLGVAGLASATSGVLRRALNGEMFQAYQGSRYAISEATELSHLTGQRAEAARAYIANPLHFQHDIHPLGSNGFLITSVHNRLSGAGIESRFSSYFSQDLWRLHYLRRDAQRREYYTSDVLIWQASRAAHLGEYADTGPREIILENVVHPGLNVYEPGQHPVAPFLRETPMGRMIGRLNQHYGMALNSVEVVPGRLIGFLDIQEMNFHLRFSRLASYHQLAEETAF